MSPWAISAIRVKTDRDAVKAARTFAEAGLLHALLVLGVRPVDGPLERADPVLRDTISVVSVVSFYQLCQLCQFFQLCQVQ